MAVDFIADPTLREQIVAKLMELCGQVTHANPEDGALFKNTFRGDPDDFDFSATNAPFVCVEDGEEEKNSDLMSNVSEKFLSVYVHVRFVRGQGGVDPFTVFNYYLGRLQSIILTNHRLGGLCRDINEVAAAPQVFAQDNLQGGYLALRVVYRHDRANPKIQR